MGTKYCTYVRVSTRKQGATGLGLAAQQKMCDDYVAQRGGTILERFQAADEAGRLLLVTDLSDALRARSLTVVYQLAGSRGVGTFLAESGTPAGEEPSP